MAEKLRTIVVVPTVTTTTVQIKYEAIQGSEFSYTILSAIYWVLLFFGANLIYSYYLLTSFRSQEFPIRLVVNDCT